MYQKKFLYEFDPSGGLAANRITGETHIITPSAGSDYDVFIPSFAPFFRKGLRVKHVPSGQYLVEGIHFDLGYHFVAASRECATPIYGCIVILDRTLSGQLTAEYQTLGGEWVLDDKEILVILANIKNDPRTIPWDDIIDKPITFPPVDHLHHSDDLVGMDEVRQAVEDIAAAIGVSAGKALNALLEHIRDHANPHQVTLAQLGLDALGNLAEASEAEVTAGTDGTHFISPRRLQFFLTGKVTALFNTHTSNKNNPHATTQAQVGLSDVPNYRMATLAEAIEGTLGNRFMSPALVQSLVKDRIDALRAEIEGGTGAVTKESIGLGLVENFPPSTYEQALAGTHNASVMTPLRVAQYVTPQILAALQAHLSASNPHQITKTTVGLGSVQNYPIATTPELIAGTANDRYVTVAGVTAMINNKISGGGGVGDLISAHIADKNNPHATTKTHVGLGSVQNYGIATDSDVQSGSDNKYVTPRGIIANLWSLLSAKAVANSITGDVGFVNGDTTTGGVVYDRIVNARVGIATTQAELDALKATDEDFSRVFNTWKRISLLNGLNSPAIPAETQRWVFDAANNAIKCTINSASLVGFVSPTSYSDYVFEVRCKSSDADDDMVGILLGCVTEGNETHTLIAARTCGGITNTAGGATGVITAGVVHLFTVTTDYATGSAKVVKSGNYGLKWGDGVVDDTRVTNPGAKGWGNWLTGTKIRAIRSGDTITITTTDLNSETYVAATQAVVNLNATPELKRFAGSSPIGYVAMSQDQASWQTITRPDARQPIFYVPTGELLTYDGNTWVASDDIDADFPVGRIYHTPLTGKTHYVEQHNEVYLIADLKATQQVWASSESIAISGEGSSASPKTATLTGNYTGTFNASSDITTGS